MAPRTSISFSQCGSPRPLARRSWWRGAGALVAVVTLAATVGLVVPPIDRASAETVGDGACASEVDGLTAQAATLGGGQLCGVLVEAGSGTWTVPSGVTTVNVELLAGGGGGGNFGGGGGGEIVFLTGPSFGSPAPTSPPVSVTPGQVISVVVGEGGDGGNHVTAPTNGGDTSFDALTARGGGAGGSWDPSTGIGTPGSAGGSGGGGAPTATVADQASPGVVEGAGGGAATASASGFGNIGGSGEGTRTNWTFSGPAVNFSSFLAGGAGGSAGLAPSQGANGFDAQLAGPHVGGSGLSIDTLGGNATSGLSMGLAIGLFNELGISVQGVLGPYGFGMGGGGGAAGNPAGTQLTGQTLGGGETESLPNSGGSQIVLPPPQPGPPPGTPNALSGQGGGGGGSLDGLRVGGNGSSGLVAIAWVPGGGAAGAPGAPTDVTGAPGSGSVDVSWTAPDSDGGSAITGYGVEWSADGGATWNVASMCSGTATSCTVTGLTNGTGYVFRVSATNANGTGPWSDPSPVVTPGSSVVPRFTG